MRSAMRSATPWATEPIKVGRPSFSQAILRHLTAVPGVVFPHGSSSRSVSQLITSDSSASSAFLMPPM